MTNVLRDIVEFSKAAAHATRRAASKVRSNEDGMAAVEFALILPIMAMMFLGAVEMSWAVSADRRVSQVASSSGDVIARSSKMLTDVSVKQITQASTWLMDQYGAENTKVVIKAVANKSGALTTVTEKWSCTYQGAANGAMGTSTCQCSTAAYTAPSGLISTTTVEGLVVSSVEFSYKPLLVGFYSYVQGQSTSGYTMTELLHFKPRSVCQPLQITGQSSPCACIQ